MIRSKINFSLHKILQKTSNEPKFNYNGVLLWIIYCRTSIDIQSRAVIFPSITTTIILLNIELKTQMILLNYIFLLLYIPSRFNINFVWLKMTNSPPLKVSLNWSLIGFDIQWNICLKGLWVISSCFWFFLRCGIDRTGNI